MKLFDFTSYRIISYFPLRSTVLNSLVSKQVGEYDSTSWMDITDAMRDDSLVVIISDTGVLMVTTEENSKKYDEEFYPVTAEGREAYGIRLVGGILIFET